MISLLVTSIVVLTNGLGTAHVDTLGAHVLSYVPAGGREVLFRQSGERRPDQWFNAGIPVCWPWFGRYGDPGSCMHGFARLLEWEVVSRQDAARESRLHLRLKSSAESARWFDGAFELDYEIVLAETLRLDLTMRNTGSRRFPVTTGFHPYFRVTDVSALTVRTPQGAIRCEPGMDGGRPFADGRYVLDDGEREIVLTSWRNNKLVIWTHDGTPLEGLVSDEWRRFACVEPAILPRMEGIWIEPQAAYEIGMSIGVTAGQP